MSRANLLRWGLGLALSAVFILVFLRGTDWESVAGHLAGANWWFLVPTTLCQLVTFVFRSLRWRWCFARDEGVSLANAAGAYSVGNFSAQIIPGRLGDLVRVYVLGKASGTSKSTALGTVAVERLSDLLAVVLMLALVLPFLSLPQAIVAAELTAASVALAALLTMLALSRAGQSVQLPHWLQNNRLLARLAHFVRLLLAGLSAFRDPRRAALILACSLVIWLFQVGLYAFSFPALHLSLGFREAVLLTGLLALATIIPAGPGYAGSFEVTARNTMALFAIGGDLSVAYLEFTRAPALIGSVIFLLGGLLALRFARPPSDKVAPPAGSSTATIES